MGVDRSVDGIRGWWRVWWPIVVWVVVMLGAAGMVVLGVTQFRADTSSAADRYRECRTEHPLGRCVEATLFEVDPDSLAGGGSR